MKQLPYPIGTRLRMTQKFRDKVTLNPNQYSKLCMEVYDLPYVTIEGMWKVQPDAPLGLMTFVETGGRWGGNEFERLPDTLPEELFVL
jgi:hypothetical protein